MYEMLKVVAQTFGVSCLSTTAIVLPGLPTSAVRIMLLVETKDVRARFNSTLTGTTAATNGVGGGLYLPKNTIQHPWFTFEGWDLLNSMCLKGDDGDAVISVIYLGYEKETMSVLH